MNENKIICFTGHRKIPDAHSIALVEALEEEVTRQILSGGTVFRAGGALGFDTLAAATVLRCKKTYPHIRLELILTCPDQTRGWTESEKRLYQMILERADSHRFVSQEYFDGLPLLRNRHLVEGADVCIAYLTRSTGGTAHTVSLALRSGLDLINLADKIDRRS